MKNKAILIILVIICSTMGFQSYFKSGSGSYFGYSMGEINYFSTTGTTITINNQSNGDTALVKVNVVTHLDTSKCIPFEVDNGGANNGRWRYTGTRTRQFHTAFTISMDGAGAATNVYVFAVAKNGVIDDDCKILQSITATGQIASTALHCQLTLSQNDYIELYVGNTTDADDIVVKSINIFGLGM